MATTISDPYNIGDYGGALSAGIGASNPIMAATNALSTGGGFFSDIFGNIQDIGSALSPAIPAIAGTLLTGEAYDRLSDVGREAEAAAMGLAERGLAGSQFKPFTVTTPTGAMFTTRMGGQPMQTMPVTSPGGFAPSPTAPPSMMLPPDMGMDQLFKEVSGLPSDTSKEDALLRQFQQQLMASGYQPPGRNELLTPLTNVTEVPVGWLAQQQPTTGGLEVGMTLSPQEQAMQQQLFGGAGDFFGQAQMPTATREQAIFERMRAAQRPEEERQRLALEERLAAQGRLGVSSAAYGGATPEMLAMATAQEEARNRAMLTAMQQAQAEQAQQAGLGQQFLGASYLPQTQLLAAAQPAQRMAELQQQAQLYGTGLFGETALSGIESRLLAEQARANLLGGIGSNILAGMFTPQVTKSGTVIDPGGFGDIGSIIEGVGSGLGGLFGNIFGRD